MSLVRAIVASALQPSTAALAQAWKGHDGIAPFSLYTDTKKRTMHRALLDAAGLLGCTVQVGFIKADGVLRYMVALPVPDADPTCRYYTVQDLELSEKAGRLVYRRINLDTIAGLRVDYKVAACP